MHKEHWCCGRRFFCQHHLNNLDIHSLKENILPGLWTYCGWQTAMLSFSYMAQSFFQVSEPFDDYISLRLIQIETIWNDNQTANSLFYVSWNTPHCMVFTPCCLVLRLYNLIQHLLGGFIFFSPLLGEDVPFRQSHFSDWVEFNHHNQIYIFLFFFFVCTEIIAIPQFSPQRMKMAGFHNFPCRFQPFIFPGV